MRVIETERLILRKLNENDSGFILKLLNDPSWLKFIGNKKVQNIEDARNYLLTGPMAMYIQLGFGLYLVQRKEGSVPIGICGLIKRDSLEDVDLGFAFLTEFQSKGYGYEAAKATLSYGFNALGLKRIVAITTKENLNSSKLLEKVGMQLEGLISLSNQNDDFLQYSKSIARKLM